MGVDILKNANRECGDWLPGVELCPLRAIPCGNPICADEAMRSAGVRQSNVYAAEQAMKHSLSIAENCQEEGVDCPLDNFGGKTKVLKKLSSS